MGRRGLGKEGGRQTGGGAGGRAELPAEQQSNPSAAGTPSGAMRARFGEVGRVAICTDAASPAPGRAQHLVSILNKCDRSVVFDKQNKHNHSRSYEPFHLQIH